MLEDLQQFQGHWASKDHNTWALSTGPPELPLLMAASVCTASRLMQPAACVARGRGMIGDAAAMGVCCSARHTQA